MTAFYLMTGKAFPPGSAIRTEGAAHGWSSSRRTGRACGARARGAYSTPWPVCTGTAVASINDFPIYEHLLRCDWHPQPVVWPSVAVGNLPIMGHKWESFVYQ